ncbi:MAG: electron transfer flavoprotein subunit alpha/FixB family protein [Candidatus Thorarchaeota archaeon]
MDGVFTFVETTRQGEIEPVSYEILAIGRTLADKLGTLVTAVHLGADFERLKAQAATLATYGADRVILVADSQLNSQAYPTLPYTRALTQLIIHYKPEIFLFGATTTGRDLAPRVAARCNAGLSADCTAFDIGDYLYKKEKKLYKKLANFIRPSFAEAKLATILGNPRKFTYPQMGTARPGAFTPLTPDPSRSPKIEQFAVSFQSGDLDVTIREIIPTTKDFVDFDRAQIIVSGGSGVTREDFSGLLPELVQAINTNGQSCELGASRRAVEEGKISRPHQVGQTGRTVRPDYYIAIGISGAIQHIEGMKNAKRIIAINKNPDARIFSFADVGIIDDYQNVIPPFLQRIKDGFRFPEVP